MKFDHNQPWVQALSEIGLQWFNVIFKVSATIIGGLLLLLIPFYLMDITVGAEDDSSFGIFLFYILIEGFVVAFILQVRKRMREIKTRGG